ncbi:MAG: hypothetical protein F4155_13825 [Acidimicrobiales bacterium]|nr:hypothetical protein [Acidimicrobiales bacterium]MYH75863.1 hypothetical protein [Acidimicrobiales bacterium]MYK71495.1 hypothetical protein [Acidimicrobiales bacterium]
MIGDVGADRGTGATKPLEHCAHRGAAAWAIVISFALIASACRSDAGEDTGASPEPADTTASGPATSLSEEQEAVVEAREAGEASGEDTRDEMAGPVHGGRLVYGIEADTANPFVHYASSCAISCRMIFRAISDSLYVTDATGAVVPYLVESEAHNEDYTEWTLQIRDGIRFHDGTPLTGEAVAYNLNLCKIGQLTGTAFLGIEEITGEGQTVTVRTALPFAMGFGPYGRAESCGFMFSPAWLETLPNNPLYSSPFSPLSPQERAEGMARATGNPAAPVGLGAFKFVSYTPGNGNSFIAERNPDYWRGANGITGEQLPYLDEIEFVVSVDIVGRSSGLKAGQFDIIHTSNADEIAKYESNPDFVLLQANDYGETGYNMVNVAAGANPVLATTRGVDEPVPMDPLGINADNPLVHLSCRKALAHAFDGERYVDELFGGIVRAANGPFPPGSMGYLEDSGYPAYDPDAAAVEFAQCKADSGQNPVTFSFNTPNDPAGVESVEYMVAMWQEVFGDELSVLIQTIEQGQFIGLMLAGHYQLTGMRNHGGVDPSEQWFWWHSASAAPVNEIALNIGRFQDPEIDALYQIIRHNPDPDARREAAEEVNRQFGRNVWNLWVTWTLWGIVADPRVQNLTNLSIPGNDAPVFPVVTGKHHLSQIWCIDGDCQG